MNSGRVRLTTYILLGCGLVLALASGCEKEAPRSPSPPVDAPRETGDAAKVTEPAPQVVEPTQGERGIPAPAQPAEPEADTEEPGRDPHAGLDLSKTPPDPHAATGSGQTADDPHPEFTELDGIRMKVPDGWVAEVPEPGELSAKAVFRLPAPDGDGESAYLRLTHFPGMKGMDEMNLQRWYGQFTQPDGRSTQEASKTEEFEAGEVKVVLADIPGTLNVAGEAKPNQRMLSAILNHPRGPHFVKVLGPEKTVAHWRDSVVAYLRSAEVTGGGATPSES